MATSESWHNVGVRIRQIRKQHGLTLKQLAHGSGLSPNAISLVERGEVAPTVMTLCKIASALGAPASSFLREICPNDVIMQRVQSDKTDHSVSRLFSSLTDSLTTSSACTLSFSNTPGKYAPQMVLCLCGQVDFESSDGQVYSLKPGDSLTCNSISPHSWRNSGPETAIAVLVFPPSPTQTHIDKDNKLS